MTLTVMKGGSKFVWPPPKQPEEDVHLCPGPTATPVYNVPGGTPITVEPSLVPKITPSFQSKSPAPSSSPSSASSAYVPAPIISPSFSNMPFASNEPPSDPTSIPSHVADVGGKQSMGISSPRRGKGVLNPQAGPGARIPVCAATGKQIRGPFLTALGKTWSPEHFVCSMDTCRRSLMDTGFVEENNKLYCESCFQQHLAPVCCKCQKRIPGDCLRAIGQHYHPECFTCAHCSKPFGTNNYFLEDGLAYCETDWTAMFTTKCFGCKFPIEAGDRWVEALNNNYHSQCFKCSMCGTLLEGQSFFAKGGRPFCRNHARA